MEQDGQRRRQRCGTTRCTNERQSNETQSDETQSESGSKEGKAKKAQGKSEAAIRRKVVIGGDKNDGYFVEDVHFG